MAPLVVRQDIAQGGGNGGGMVPLAGLFMDLVAELKDEGVRAVFGVDVGQLLFGLVSVAEAEPTFDGFEVLVVGMGEVGQGHRRDAGKVAVNEFESQ